MQVGVHTVNSAHAYITDYLHDMKKCSTIFSFSFACILLLQMLSHIVTKFRFCLLQSDSNVIMTDFSADPIGSFGDKYEELLRCCLIIVLKLLRKSIIQQSLPHFHMLLLGDVQQKTTFVNTATLVHYYKIFDLEQRSSDM